MHHGAKHSDHSSCPGTGVTPVAIRTSCIRELDEKDQMGASWLMEYRELDVVKHRGETVRKGDSRQSCGEQEER